MIQETQKHVKEQEVSPNRMCKSTHSDKQQGRSESERRRDQKGKERKEGKGRKEGKERKEGGEGEW